MDYIYALFWMDGDRKEYFYVGRTIDPDRRKKEHEYCSKNGHESKYQFIRALKGCALLWDMEILQFCGPETERYEDFYVYDLTLRGHPLQNERKGDARGAAERDAERALRGRNAVYSSPQAFLDARAQEIAEAEHRAKAARLHARLAKEKAASNSDPLRTLVHGERVEERFVSPAGRALLARYGRKR
jgi:hypothetical protein